MNRWLLTPEIQDKYTPIVQAFINKLENTNIENSADILEQDFSDTELNPSQLVELLENLGYKEESRGDNGWELDFWINMYKSNFKSIQVTGCGMTFELQLSEKD